MKRIFTGILNSLEAIGHAFLMFAIIAIIVAIYAIAIFGGEINVKVNNPFFDEKEVSE